MIPRQVKAAYYAFASPLMAMNGHLYRRLRAPRSGSVKIHLGPGQRTYLPGWINIDANVFTGRCDVWADLRNPLPFCDGTVDACYSHHMIEHLPDVRRHLADVFRCLKPGGVYRVGGPNGDSAIAKFVADDRNWFSRFPEDRSSIGGRFENMIFCRGEHLTILTYSYLEELMTAVGFIGLTRCRPTLDTGHVEWFGDCLEKEYESDFEYPHTLIVEARRP